MRLYRLKHREEIRKKAKIYRIEHRDELRISRLAYKLKNKEKIKEKRKIYLEKNKDKITKQAHEYAMSHRKERYIYNIKNKKRKRERELKVKYGLSLEEYNNILKLQNGVCAICYGVGGKKGLAVDHCHKTNKIRGLLCSNCNCSIGLLKENIELLDKIKIYLLKYK